ncbi:MAG TPA: hypothetical protein VMM38_10260 [Aridibacter sp.]|nr:hypothetical protein [Aridibacter sp.]
MFGNSEKQDEKVGEGVVAFTELLSDTRFLYRTIQIFGVLNITLWIIAVLFADRVIGLVDLLGRFGDKPRLVPFVIPFFAGWVLVYSLARLQSPDLEDRKLLDSDVMGSIAYNSEANRRFFTWIVAILAGVLNALGFIFAVNAMSTSGLTLVS